MTLHQRNKIQILGSGPSGLTAAITLAKAGKEVHVFERKDDCGARFMGDLQGLENWTTHQDVLELFQELGLEINFDCSPFSELKLSDGQKLSKEFNFNRPLFYLVKRGVMPGSLDDGLKQQALKAGVQIHFNHSIPPNEADIIATGPETRKIVAIDKGIIFQTDLPDMAIGLVNDKAAYKGYSYLLITGGYACICTVLFDQFNRIDDCFQYTIEKFKSLVNLNIQDPKRVGGLGHFSLNQRFSEHGKLFVGEAAGLQDLLWGFGIRSAVLSGHLAAKSIIEGTDYQSLASQAFQHKMKATVVLRYLYEKLSRFGYGFLVNTTHSRADVREFLRKSHRYTWIHQSIFPLAISSLRRRWDFI